MRYIVRFITQLITDPWTYYFLAMFVICAIVYVFGDRREK